MWRTRGIEAAVAEAGRSSGNAVMVELVNAFNQTPAVWTLTLCATVLPYIETLLASKDEGIVEVCINLYARRLRT